MALRRFSSGLAVATVDGLYLAALPVAGLVAPVAAFVLGGLIGATHPGFNVVFTEALWLLILVAGVGAASGAVGFYLTLGFALGDLLLGAHPLWRAGTYEFVSEYGSALLSYALFGLLAVGVPIAAKSLASEFVLPASVPRPVRALVGLLAMVVITALLVFAWTQCAPLLVRPVFVWVQSPPTVAAIAPLQEREGWIVAVAALAALGRAVMQFLLALNMGRQLDRLGELEARFRSAPPVVPLLSRMPLPARLVLRAAVLTALLSGLYDGLWQALLTFAVLFGAQVLASPLVPFSLGAYGRFLARIPRLLRILIALVPVYLLGTAVLDFFIRQGTTSFIPFLLLTVVSAILTTLLMPAAAARQEGRR